MDFEKALELSKEEFNKMAKFQELLLNLNDENYDEVQNYSNVNFDFTNHSSIQKFCHIIGSIASVRPNQISFIMRLFDNHKKQIDSILNKNERRLYVIFTILNDLDGKQNGNTADLQQNEQDMINSKLTNFIENDDLDKFQTFLSQTNTKVNQKVRQNKFYMKRRLSELELIEYSALCGSLNIFKFLLNQLFEYPIRLTNFAVAGGNYEIIHILEQAQLDRKLFIINQEAIEFAIEFHRNDIIEYLIETYELEFDSKSLNVSIITNNFILMNKYIENEELFNDFYQVFFNDFTTKVYPNPISSNIPLIEFAVKIKNEGIQQKSDFFLLCISLLNYDSVAECLITYKPDLIKEDKNVIEAVFASLHNKSFNAIIVFIKFLHKFQEKKFLIQEIFNTFSSHDNELTDLLLTFDDVSINNEFSPLLFAIRDGNLSFLKKLLNNNKIDVNAINPISHVTPLMYAYQKEKFDIFKYLLDDVNVDVNKKDLRGGATVLHYACFDNNLKYVKLLIENNSININIKNDSNQTPLHLAAIENNIEIVEFLVEIGKADVEIKDNSGVFFFFIFSNILENTSFISFA